MVASGSVKIYKKDSRICFHDNGTDTCDRGHSLTTIGLCFSQPIGTYNTSGNSCTSDYLGSTNSTYSIVDKDSGIEGSFGIFYKSDSSGFISNILKSYSIILFSIYSNIELIWIV